MLLLGVEMPQLCSPSQGAVHQLHSGTFQLAAERALAPLPGSLVSGMTMQSEGCYRGCSGAHCFPPHFFPMPGGTSASAPLPSKGTVVVGLLLDLPLSSTAWGMQVHKQPWMQPLVHTSLCLDSRSSGLRSQQCGLVVRPLKSQAAPTSPCRCTLPSLEISVGAESAH